LSTKRSSQRGPAVALAQLLSEHPELPAIRWELAADGHLSGLSMYMEADVRPVAAAYAVVLGGVPDTRWHEDTELCTSWLYTTWRDVPVSITLGCSAEFAPGAVTALPQAWHAAGAA
jgi:hypothetical protein